MALALCRHRRWAGAVQTGQPSHTARGAAAYRAIHQTLEGGTIFSDPFASKILDDESRPRARPVQNAAKCSTIAAGTSLIEEILMSFFETGFTQWRLVGAAGIMNKRGVRQHG